MSLRTQLWVIWAVWLALVAAAAGLLWAAVDYDNGTVRVEFIPVVLAGFIAVEVSVRPPWKLPRDGEEEPDQ